MGVPKGTDNFKAFRAERQRSALELLRAELARARRRKMPYPNLATIVADMAERSRIHRTTLVRNPTYHRLLLEFLGSQAGGSTIVADKDASPGLLRAKLIDAQMEIGYLRNKLASATAAARPATVGAKSVAQRLTEPAAHSAFADTVCVLREVIERLNIDGVVFEVDLDRGEIRDLAAAPGRHVVVSGRRVRPFIEAYRTLLQQEGLEAREAA